MHRYIDAVRGLLQRRGETTRDGAAPIDPIDEVPARA